MALDGRPDERRAVIGLVAAVVLGSTLGLGILYYVHGARRQAKTAAATTAVGTVTAVAADSTAAAGSAANGVVELDPPPSTAVVATAEAVPAAAANPSSAAAPTAVKLRITPPTAVIVVDGVVMPPGTDTVARAVDGGTVSVLVRADRHQDTIVLVDPTTSESLDVNLVPAVRRTAAPSNKPKDSEGGPEAPPNPYE